MKKLLLQKETIQALLSTKASGVGGDTNECGPLTHGYTCGTGCQSFEQACPSLDIDCSFGCESILLVYCYTGQKVCEPYE